ncbi:MAG: hypothetical protein ORN98_04115, partial [Alphaproteobacteria bacterium]|nr:hypothetical protein [Alphaproteobacteria bacterium]
ALTRMSIAMRSATAASVVTGATTGATSMMTTGAALAAAGGGGLLAKIGLGKGGAIASLFGKANGIKGAGFIGTGLLAATVIPSIFDEDQSFGAKARSITELVAGIGGMLAGGAIGGVLGSALPGAGNVALGLAGGYGGYEIGSRGGGALYDGIFGTPTTKPANQYAIAEDPWLRGKSEQTATSTANAVKIENEAGVITLNYSPVVNIYGEATPENYRRQTEMLQRHKDDLIDMVQKSFDDMARRKQAAIGAS